MKKLIAIVAIAAFIVSCDSGTSTNSESNADSSMTDKKMSSDSMGSMSSSSMMSTTAEGTMTMKDGKMMVMMAGK